MMPRALHPTGAVLALGLLLGLCACASGGKAVAPPQSAAPSQPELIHDAKAIQAAQRRLAALGYETGAKGVIDGETEKAVRSFQRDQKLGADGRLTASLAEALKAAAAKLPGRSSWALPERGMLALFDDAPSGRIERAEPGKILWIGADGTRLERPANFLLDTGDGASSDAPQNFLQPLKPGSHGSYTLSRSSGPPSTVSCTVGHLARVTVAAGTFDAIDVTCRESTAGQAGVERRWLYAPELRLVVRQDAVSAGKVTQRRELVGLRPPMQAWPAAAREGFDWALTHALENADEPVQWSSTGVPDRFTIQIEHIAAASRERQKQASHCLHYVVARSVGEPARRYSGLACETKEQGWEIPARTPYRIARPAQGLPPRAAARPAD